MKWCSKRGLAALQQSELLLKSIFALKTLLRRVILKIETKRYIDLFSVLPHDSIA